MSSQVIVTPCCNKVIASFVEPTCYVDVPWMKLVRVKAQQGFLIKITKGTPEPETCTCKEDEKKKKIEMSKQQLNLF